MENDSTPTLEERVVAAVGQDGLRALRSGGLAVVDTVEIEEYHAETNQQVERLRTLVRAATAAAETRAVVFDVLPIRIEGGKKSDGVRFVLCDPVGDEESLCRRIVGALGFAAEDLGATGIDAPPPKRT
jgi:hypothetical protein